MDRSEQSRAVENREEKYAERAERVAVIYLKTWLKKHLSAAMAKPKFRKCFERGGLTYHDDRKELEFKMSNTWDGTEDTKTLEVN